VEGVPVNAGKLVLSPTRTYAPVIKKLLDELRPEIHGMVHCTGGAQTKVLHFVGENCKVVKDNMFPVPPLFRLIARLRHRLERDVQGVQHGTPHGDLRGVREVADKVIAVSKSFNIDAQVVGHIEEGNRSLTIKSEFGTFEY
jgi:phosphoribosylformylglycinamidine cyclo-ligase